MIKHHSVLPDQYLAQECIMSHRWYRISATLHNRSGHRCSHLHFLQDHLQVTISQGTPHKLVRHLEWYVLILTHSWHLPQANRDSRLSLGNSRS